MPAFNHLREASELNFYASQEWKATFPIYLWEKKLHVFHCLRISLSSEYSVLLPPVFEFSTCGELFLFRGRGHPSKEFKHGIPALSWNYAPDLIEALSRCIRNDSQVRQSSGKIPESSLVILRTGTVPLCTYYLMISCFAPPFPCVSHGLANLPTECKSSVKVKLFLSVWTLSTLCSQIFY